MQTCCLNALILLFQFVSITRDLLDPAPPVALGVGWKNIWQPADPGLRVPSGTPGSRLFVEFLFVVWFAPRSLLLSLFLVGFAWDTASC